MDPVTLFAPSFDAGARDFPSPTRGTDVFKGWTTEAAGGGDAFTTESVLLGSSPDGIPADATAHAWWATTPKLVIGVAGDAATITAGETLTFTPTVVDEFGDAYPTDPADWTLTDAGGQVTVVVNTVAGEITLASTSAGVYEIELTVPTPPGDLAATITVTVVPAATAALDLEASADAVDQGGSVTVTAAGSDEFGNPTGDVTGQTTFTSDVDTDTIDANTITFPSASVHTVTATHTGGAIASIAITVNPPGGANNPPGGANDSLPDTGGEGLAGVLVSLLLIAAGLTTIATVNRRRHTPQHLRT